LLKKMHLKNVSTVLIAVLNTISKLMLFVVKLNNLKVRCKCKDNCKLRYFKNVHYFTLLNCSVIFCITYSTTMNFKRFNTYIYAASSYKCR